MAEMHAKYSIDRTLGWQAVLITHPGKVRSINEDCGLANSSQAHWVVADGMGGHQAGDLASQMIINNLQPLNQSGNLTQFIEDIEKTLLGVNENLYQLGQSRNTIIGSTVVGAVLHQQHMVFYWVGDSRGYLHRQEHICQITVDHTLVQELVEQNKITPEEAKNHPEKNVITRSVGAHPELFVDYSIVAVEPGDKILICSDGIEKELPDDVLENIINQHSDIDQAANAILKEALSSTARDNITFALITLDNAEKLREG